MSLSREFSDLTSQDKSSPLNKRSRQLSATSASDSASSRSISTLTATVSSSKASSVAMKAEKKKATAMRSKLASKKSMSTSSTATVRRSATVQSGAPVKRAKAEPRRSKTTSASSSSSSSGSSFPIVPLKHRASAKRVGAHVSIAGGISRSVQNICEIGGTAFAIFTGAQRTWNYKPVTPEEVALFRKYCAENGFSSTLILPHGTYLVNLASPDEELRVKSRNRFLAELQRCEELGIGLYNIHPGSTRGQISLEEGIKNIADGINWACTKTSSVKVVLENTAGGGHTIGRSFEELRDIIALVKDKNRVGVCLDTCHMFAAGYDVRTKEAYLETIQKFSDIVGMNYLMGMHLNDSKVELGSNRDRHECLGKGFIGLECFRALMNDDRLNGIPLVLETPIPEKWEEEIALLYSMESE